MSKIEVVNGKIHAGAGARLKQIVAVAKANGIMGLEFMEGIPGALGGAMRMNAGAMESWTFETIESVSKTRGYCTDDFFGFLDDIFFIYPLSPKYST
jgi:UDP-N-acetylenolpyruvoylglucosamine reductase